MRVLYVSQNGMLENLGQSQVLPYLRGLARRGIDIELMSFELEGVAEGAVETLRDSLAADRIHWSPLRRRRDGRLRVKVAESARGVMQAMGSALARRPDIVHGRSYFSTAVCDVVASVVPRAKLLFDCRGMIGDEYVDIGHWTKDRIEYRLVKGYEWRAFKRADGVVVLARALEHWLVDQGWLGPRTHIETVPCCADLSKFRFDPYARDRIRKELGIDDALVILYAGSLGPWYCEEQVARFSGLLKKQAAGRRVAFLLLSGFPPDALVKHLAREGIPESDVAIRKVAPADMPTYLSAGDVALSFIFSCFSKKGTSPTKVAEYLACGLPIVVNGDIGDQGELAEDERACVVMDTLTDEAIAAAVPRALALATRPLDDRVRDARAVAEKRFGVENVGVPRYERLYRAMVERKKPVRSPCAESSV